MSKKGTAPWAVFLRGSLLALGVYLLGLLLLALLIVKGTLPENAVFPVIAVLCAAAVFLGGMLTAKGSPLGKLPSTMLVAVLFAAILVFVGAACWRGIAWTGRGGILLLCALAGGLAAGLASSGKRRTKKRKRK